MQPNTANSLHEETADTTFGDLAGHAGEPLAPLGDLAPDDSPPPPLAGVALNVEVRAQNTIRIAGRGDAYYVEADTPIVLTCGWETLSPGVRLPQIPHTAQLTLTSEGPHLPLVRLLAPSISLSDFRTVPPLAWIGNSIVQSVPLSWNTRHALRLCFSLTYPRRSALDFSRVSVVASYGAHHSPPLTLEPLRHTTFNAERSATQAHDQVNAT